MTESVITPTDKFYQWESETPDLVFLRQPTQLEWQEYTWAEVAERVRRVCTFIRQQNFPHGSRIGIWSANSMDWVIVDFAIQMSGHVGVPLYPGQDLESAQYILDHSDTRMLFLGEFDIAVKFSQHVPEGMKTVAIRGCKITCETDLDTIYAENEPYPESPVPGPEDLFTLIYTSGTTGNPKGVMFTHKKPGLVGQRIANAFGQAAEEAFGPLEGRPSYFSYLPMSHVAERLVIELQGLYTNGTISFSEGLQTFAQELKSVRPTFFFSVPRLWVKFKEGVDKAFPPEVQAGFTDEHKAMVRQNLGLDRARFIMTGSAPCPKDVQDWYINMGMTLREAYGASETFADGAFWGAPGEPVLGCVGKPVEGTTMKLSEEGELLIRSECIMDGYYLNPEKTAEVMVDGWYKTGDTAKIDEDGNIWITGRISETFKTSKGKFIKPSRLEQLLGALVDLGQLCIFGHGKDQPLLLASLSELGETKGQEELTASLEQSIVDLNAELPAHERIGQVFITKDLWAIENGLLTPTLKVKRKALEDYYSDFVAANLGNGQTIVWE